MREIKFRVWDKKAKKMINWDLICVNWSPRALKSNFHYDVMQYTGLHDKNNVEIYEGDIIKFVHRNGGKLTMAKVYYDEDGACFELDSGWNGLSDTADNEVVGNVYENKNLTEGVI